MKTALYMVLILVACALLASAQTFDPIDIYPEPYFFGNTWRSATNSLIESHSIWLDRSQLRRGFITNHIFKVDDAWGPLHSADWPNVLRKERAAAIFEGHRHSTLASVYDLGYCYEILAAQGHKHYNIDITCECEQLTIDDIDRIIAETKARLGIGSASRTGGAP